MRSLLGIVLLTLVAAGCDAKVGPFYPAKPIACSSDAQCDDHHVCRFPCRMPDLSGNACRPICMDGENSITGYPDTSPGGP
jgi:hypothetical protein